MRRPSSNLDLRVRHRLDSKRRRLDHLRPLDSTPHSLGGSAARPGGAGAIDSAQVKKLQAALQLEMTYNSNAIEGNALTLRETQLVLEQGITIKGKPLRDHLEAKDHQEALDFLYELTARGRVTLSAHLIRQFHHLVTRETEREWAGRYRLGAVTIAGGSHRPPEAIDVPRLMSNLIRWIGTSPRHLHPAELAAIVHHRLGSIHPFVDGNGRTARLVMNCLLLRKGYPLVVILKADCKKYYRVLQQADTGNEQPLVLFVAQAVERSLDLYLRTLARTPDRLITLAQASRGSTYSAKYLNLLAASGRLAAHKRGRNWFTTERDLEEYRLGRLRKR